MKISKKSLKSIKFRVIKKALSKSLDYTFKNGFRLQRNFKSN